jgi:hypothetical protein
MTVETSSADATSRFKAISVQGAQSASRDAHQAAVRADGILSTITARGGKIEKEEVRDLAGLIYQLPLTDDRVPHPVQTAVVQTVIAALHGLKPELIPGVFHTILSSTSAHNGAVCDAAIVSVNKKIADGKLPLSPQQKAEVYLHGIRYASEALQKQQLVSLLVSEMGNGSLPDGVRAEVSRAAKYYDLKTEAALLPETQQILKERADKALKEKEKGGR